MDSENSSSPSDRRFAVSFDPEHFNRLAIAGQLLAPIETFRHAYETHLWSGAESRSGAGSGPDQARVLLSALPDLCRRLQVRTLLDLPCGDWHWMATVPLEDLTYIGADLLPEIVTRNQAAYGRPGRAFMELDLTSSPLPAADLLLCRDCLVHLEFRDIGRALENLHRARISYLLCTTFPTQEANVDIRTGDWRPVNLQASPFSFPPPNELINEGCTEGDGRFSDKSLGLWRVDDLPRALEMP
jgi:hypothetical protein